MEEEKDNCGIYSNNHCLATYSAVGQESDAKKKEEEEVVAETKDQGTVLKQCCHER